MPERPFDPGAKVVRHVGKISPEQLACRLRQRRRNHYGRYVQQVYLDTRIETGIARAMHVIRDVICGQEASHHGELDQRLRSVDRFQIGLPADLKERRAELIALAMRHDADVLQIVPEAVSAIRKQLDVALFPLRAKYDVRVFLAPVSASILIQVRDPGRVRPGFDPATAGVRAEPEWKCLDLRATAAPNVDIPAEKGQRRPTVYFDRLSE